MSCSCQKKKVIRTDKAPQPFGPYSAGIRRGRMVYTAGQAALDPATGQMVTGGIEAETRQTLTNIQAILEAAGSDLNHVLKTTVFMTDLAEFPRMNAVYAEFFTENPPARSTVQVAALPKGALVEIETIAYVEGDCCGDENCDCDCDCDCKE
jgi:2-iminobutanoate/2-iminopropanoate deaminase